MMRTALASLLALSLLGLSPRAEASARARSAKSGTTNRANKARTRTRRTAPRKATRTRSATARTRKVREAASRSQRVARRVQSLAKMVYDKSVPMGILTGKGIPRAPSRSGRLIVVNKGLLPGPGRPHNSSIALIDLKTGKLVKNIKTPEGPHEIAVSPNMRRAVAPHYGGQPQEDPLSSGGGDSISVLDLKSEKLTNIKLGRFFRPHGVEWLDNDRVAITVDGTKKSIARGYVLVVNTATRKIEAEIPTKQPGSHLVRMAPNGRDLYVTNIQGQSLTVLRRARKEKIDPTNPWKTAKAHKTIKTGPGAEGFDIHPTRNEIWVANQDNSTVTVIDRTSLEKVRTFTVKGGPIRVQFTPDKKYAIATLRKGNALAVLDAQSGKELRRIPMEVPRISGDKGIETTSSVPMMVQFHPRSKNLLYVGNSHSRMVSVVDWRKGQVVGYYKGGDKPDPLAWYPGR